MKKAGWLRVYLDEFDSLEGKIDFDEFAKNYRCKWIVSPQTKGDQVQQGMTVVQGFCFGVGFILANLVMNLLFHIGLCHG